jgi:hypothetical protein
MKLQGQVTDRRLLQRARRRWQAEHDGKRNSA